MATTIAPFKNFNFISFFIKYYLIFFEKCARLQILEKMKEMNRIFTYWRSASITWKNIPLVNFSAQAVRISPDKPHAGGRMEILWRDFLERTASEALQAPN